MAFAVTRSKIRINPDHKKVIPRFFNAGNERSLLILKKLMKLKEKEVTELLQRILAEFAGRYRNIHFIFLKHFNRIRHLLTSEEEDNLSEECRFLLGAYFTMEYAVEAAALFNPSIVEDIDQEGMTRGKKRVVVSFRATGESHISSIVFNRGILDAKGNIQFEPAGKFITEGDIPQHIRNNKEQLGKTLSVMKLPADIISLILQPIQESFSFKEIEQVLKEALLSIDSAAERKRIRFDILSKINTNYEVNFPADTLLSERVLFPVTSIEKNGIEDARFVRFEHDNGSFTYIATYTAYDGINITPQLLLTNDFCHFKINNLHGKMAINKNLALFPRKINDRYAMLSRIDGMNNYIMFSDDLYVWEEAILLEEPKFPWQYIQLGNAGSPIETDKGWLVITHGVGPMRKYCLGASLFQLEDPTVSLGQLREPLLTPNEDERDGYVPNVLYSCGSIVHGNLLVIPYAVSDYACAFATVPLDALLDEILNPAS